MFVLTPENSVLFLSSSASSATPQMANFLIYFSIMRINARPLLRQKSMN